MTFAILAAGEGSRLAQEGVEQPKPLVKISGEAMIDRLIRIFNECGAENIYIITNNLTPLTQNHLHQLQAANDKIHLLVKTTPSSMHSFYELRQSMGDGKFCLTTVDTIFREEEFTAYVDSFRKLTDSGEADGVMGVTDFIDDEKPLYVETDERSHITAFLDKSEHPHYISGGIYGLTPRSLHTLEECIKRGESRMRNFQRALVADGLRLQAWPFSKVLDIDHADDIAKAEAFLKG